MNLELAARLGVQAQPNAKHDNFVDESVQIGSKSTVALRLHGWPRRNLGVSKEVLCLHNQHDPIMAVFCMQK